MAERAAGLGGDVDLAVLQPLDQLVGRQVDDLDLGAIEYAVGHRFADATRVKLATTSLRLSTCWTLSVV